MRIAIFVVTLLVGASCSTHQKIGRNPSSIEKRSEVYQVGDIKISLLTPDRFRSLHGDVWVLMDGGEDIGNIQSGNSHATIYELGIDRLPDARGKFLRMNNNGITGVAYDPDTSRSLGSYQADEFKSHVHSNGIQLGDIVDGWGDRRPYTNASNTGAAGGAETRPKNISVNFYIKISSCPEDASETVCL